MKTYQAFDRDVEKFNAKTDVRHKLFVACGNQGLGTVATSTAFELVDSLTTDLYNSSSNSTSTEILLQRAVAYTMVQNYADAIADLDLVVQNDSTISIAWWQRAVCQTMLNNYNIAQGIDARMKTSLAMEDLDRALSLAPNNAYVYYDRAALHLSAGDTAAAIEDYTTAIRLEPHLAEAYYNRGLVYYDQGDNTSATRDLSKAGELGLYDAYSVMKRMK